MNAALAATERRKILDSNTPRQSSPWKTGGWIDGTFCTLVSLDPAKNKRHTSGPNEWNTLSFPPTLFAVRSLILRQSQPALNKRRDHTYSSQQAHIRRLLNTPNHCQIWIFYPQCVLKTWAIVALVRRVWFFTVSDSQRRSTTCNFESTNATFRIRCMQRALIWGISRFINCNI